MKRLLSLILVLTMLFGAMLPAYADDTEGKGIGSAILSGLSSALGGTSNDPDVIRFSDMVYTRPDLDAFRADVQAVAAALDKGGKLKTIMMLCDQVYEDYYSYDTMTTLADIHHCIDMTDPFWAEEIDWCNSNYSNVHQLMDNMYYACGTSSLAGKLEKRYFWTGFAEEYANPEESSYSDEMVALMQKESDLLSQYYRLMTGPTLEHEGEERDFYNLLAEANNEEYMEYMLKYYRKYEPQVAEIYIELVRVRTEIAQKLGYESVEEMQYATYERDYTPEQTEKFLQDIAKYMVPLYRRVVNSSQYGRVRYDWLDDVKLFSILDRLTAKCGGDIRDAFEFMAKRELYDISFSNVKIDMSFQEYISDYEAPFLFMDAEEDTYDILTLVHEFGHFVEAYVNQNAYETIDLAEVYSQSMEYLSLMNLNGILTNREIRNLKMMKLIDTIEMYVQQASFAEFEHEIYQRGADELTSDVINEISLEMAKKYGYCDEDQEEYYAMSWISISHFFDYPFYVVSYPVSNDAAMQIYSMEYEQEGAGSDKFCKLLDRSYTTLINTLEEAGLESPFAENRIYEVTVLLEKELGL